MPPAVNLAANRAPTAHQPAARRPPRAARRAPAAVDPAARRAPAAVDLAANRAPAAVELVGVESEGDGLMGGRERAKTQLHPRSTNLWSSSANSAPKNGGSGLFGIAPAPGMISFLVCWKLDILLQRAFVLPIGKKLERIAVEHLFQESD
uniref:Uncharacterized protein K0081B11.9 n=1 Tax=Oryza sativa subsp. indica TaxID=39946 RepID=C8TF48_ORYSI|nr:hypothetical protein [Oryza sativa Indica Group]BAI39983.1 hypothetical protein [Oryza sativa Indica Group]